MALSFFQNVPIALRPAWDNLLHDSGWFFGQYDTRVSLRMVFPQTPPKNRFEPQRIKAALSAEWLADNHPSEVAIIGREQFVFARKSELSSRIYNPAYFVELVPFMNITEFATPTVVTPGPEQPPQFSEPGSLNSTSVWSSASSSYSTPPPGTPLPSPSPGYFAELSGGIWRDVWLAQQRLRYTLPAGITSTDVRRVWLDSTNIADMRASNAGNSSLGAFFVVSSYGRNGSFDVGLNSMIAARRRKVARFQRFLNQAGTGYSRVASIPAFSSFPPENFFISPFELPRNELQIIMSPVPSGGFMHYLNAWQSSSWIFSPRVYWPKKEGE